MALLFPRCSPSSLRQHMGHLSLPLHLPPRASPIHLPTGTVSRSFPVRRLTHALGLTQSPLYFGMVPLSSHWKELFPLVHLSYMVHTSIMPFVLNDSWFSPSSPHAPSLPPLLYICRHTCVYAPICMYITQVFIECTMLGTMRNQNQSEPSFTELVV